MKNKADEIWEELCAASSPATPVPQPRVHPFESRLGKGPYRFEGLVHSPDLRRPCQVCGKSIANLYQIANGEGAVYNVGSECVLGLGEGGFSGYLVGQVRAAKRRYDAQKRAAAKARNRAAEVAEARAESLAAHPAECAWLQSYSGNFSFYLSLKQQFEQRGGLSDRQWECVRNAIQKASQPKPAQVFTLAVGETLIVSKFFARIIGQTCGLNRPHYAIEVLEVQAESQKAYKVKGRLSAQRTSHCCVCGLTLTNPSSVLAGIGPICADKYGVETTEELHAKLLTEFKATVETWIPKSQIKERKPALPTGRENDSST